MIMQIRQVVVRSRIPIFALFLAFGICPVETMRNCALAGQQGPAGGSSVQSPASLPEVAVISESAGSLPAYDERFKADILLVVAHPDDEGMVTAYLARALDENKRVAVLYCTRGDHGGDLVGSATAVGDPDGSFSQGIGKWQQITWHAQSKGQEIGSATINVFLEQRGGMPQ